MSWVCSFIAADHVNRVADPLGRQRALLKYPDPSCDHTQGRLQVVGERCEKLILQSTSFFVCRVGPCANDGKRYLSRDHIGELQLISSERATNIGVEHELADHHAAADERDEGHRFDALGGDDLEVRLERRLTPDVADDDGPGIRGVRSPGRVPLDGPLIGL
jgi:hypothetical protein